MTLRPLHYFDRLAHRPLEAVKLAVIHATELPSLSEARIYGDRIHYHETATGNSGHYYIDRDGCMECWVPPEYAAHHVRDFNQQSVGIELVNLGRFPNWFDRASQCWQEPYLEAQLGALENLLNQLKLTLPALQYITGHDQLDVSMVQASDAADQDHQVRRKVDPGPLFPWPRVLAATQLHFIGEDDPLIATLRDPTSSSLS